LREVRDLPRLADIDVVDRDFLRTSPADLGGGRLQPRLVAIGQRQIAAARRQLKRQRPADAAGSAGHGGGSSTDRGH
jgi:hypothetical protein